MSRKNAVVGQTGRIVLSEDSVFRKLAQKRTLRYQYQKIGHGWIVWVCGPFHSRMYGVCGFGTKRARAKLSLERNLAENYGYIGNLLFSDVDDADIVALSPTELWNRSNNEQRDELRLAFPVPIKT